MQRSVIWIKRTVIFSVLALMVIAVIMREEIHRLVNVKTLFEEDKIVQNFSSLDQVFETIPLSRGDAPVFELSKGTPLQLPEGFDDWVAERAVTSLLVLHKGAIIHESYHLNTNADDLRIGWALSTPYLSALTGILLADGTLKSLDDLVPQYVPSLAGTAYEKVRLRDLLLMTSGVDFDEDYFAYNSDINRMGRELALGGTLDEFTQTLKDNHSEPGDIWNYVSLDAHVLAMVIRSASGKGLPELLEKHLLHNLGLETPAYVLSDAANVAFLPGGLNKTTRDFARFGLMFEQMGELGGIQVIPKEWVEASTKATAPRDDNVLGYGYHWWVPSNAPAGQFFAHGIYGQYIFVDQAKDVVIVSTAADLDFIEAGFHEANLDYFMRILDSL